MRVAAYNKMRGGSGLARPTFCSLHTYADVCRELYFPKLKLGMVGEYCLYNGKSEVLGRGARVAPLWYTKPPATSCTAARARGAVG